ncbi:MAG: DUF86 domain-containing protein [Phormidium tanganyikae FI6-MK23]|nr:DUF86 domain-containing protein [Phormidium tanganyikae FI6-MK23]
MSSRDWRLRIRDILCAIEEIQTFIVGMDYETFEQNSIVVKAVLYNLVILGEATRGIPLEIQQQSSSLLWRLMTGMRNIVAHEYFQVDVRRVWDTALNDLPELVEPLKVLLESS